MSSDKRAMTARVSVVLDGPDRLALIKAAAARSLRAQRPVSVSEVAREYLRRGLQREAAKG